jgi:hypothetical protein
MPTEVEPQELPGCIWRDDLQAWAAGYKISGKSGRKVFGADSVDRQNAINWLKNARSLRRKEGGGASL